MNILIPKQKEIVINHIVLDYNGTLAKDGKIYDGVINAINTLAKTLSIHIITADTFGSVKTQIKGANCKLEILKTSDHETEKMEYVKSLGAINVAAYGNGRNDSLMLKEAQIGIGILQDEGIATATLFNSDIICKSIFDALDLFINTKRLIATLRK